MAFEYCGSDWEVVTLYLGVIINASEGAISELTISVWPTEI